MWGWGGRPGYFWGGLLVVLGLLFLAGNLQLLNNLSWDYIWPSVLIALGVWLIAVRMLPGGASAAGATMDITEARDGLEKAKLQIAVGAARLDVRGAALGDLLYHARIDYSGQQPEVRFDRATGDVRISQPSDLMMGAWRRFKLDLQLSDALSWDVDCSTGAIRATIDLSTVPLARFECKTGASRIDLSVSKPAGEVPIRIQGGALRVELNRPAGAAARVRVSGGAIRFVADGTTQDGIGSREWRSSDFDAATDRYDAQITGGAITATMEQR